MTGLPSLAIVALLDAYRSGHRIPDAVARDVLAAVDACSDPAV